MDPIKTIRERFYRWRYRAAAGAVRRCAPLAAGSLPFVLLSMVHRRDVLSYLVALYSFTRQANPRQVVVVCDPSIREQDRAILRHHVPHIVLHDAAEFTAPALPRGGTWERLLAIARYARAHYVVQLDADTVTVGAIAEVREAIAANRAFVLGTDTANPILDLAQTRRNALPSVAGGHVQALAEAALGEMDWPAATRYVRGCSGFAGFPPAPDMEARLADFSARMGARLGVAWQRWGSEQVASNFMIANSAGALVLPFPQYATPNRACADRAFLHFIGWLRFANGDYARATTDAIAGGN